MQTVLSSILVSDFERIAGFVQILLAARKVVARLRKRSLPSVSSVSSVTSIFTPFPFGETFFTSTRERILSVLEQTGVGRREHIHIFVASVPRSLFGLDFGRLRLFTQFLEIDLFLLRRIGLVQGSRRLVVGRIGCRFHRLGRLFRKEGHLLQGRFFRFQRRLPYIRIVADDHGRTLLYRLLVDFVFIRLRIRRRKLRIRFRLFLVGDGRAFVHAGVGIEKQVGPVIFRGRTAEQKFPSVVVSRRHLGLSLPLFTLILLHHLRHSEGRKRSRSRFCLWLRLRSRRFGQADAGALRNRCVRRRLHFLRRLRRGRLPFFFLDGFCGFFPFLHGLAYARHRKVTEEQSQRRKEDDRADVGKDGGYAEDENTAQPSRDRRGRESFSRGKTGEDISLSRPVERKRGMYEQCCTQQGQTPERERRSVFHEAFADQRGNAQIHGAHGERVGKIAERARQKAVHGKPQLPEHKRTGTQYQKCKQREDEPCGGKAFLGHQQRLFSFRIRFRVFIRITQNLSSCPVRKCK